MRYLAILAAAGMLLAQHGSKKQKDAPAPPPADPEERYACQLDQGFHKCSCPYMVNEVQEPLYKKCEALEGKAYRDCVAKIPSHCDIVQKADTSHSDPAMNAKHTCSRSCRRARCKCEESTTCFGPSLTEPSYDNGDN